jgi:CubicO group peptidase (beta-lactamase class C family)/beta-glucosidase-like glycosyl hydrolase
MDLRARAARLVVVPLEIDGDSAVLAERVRGVAGGAAGGVWIDGGAARRVAALLARLRQASPLPLLAAASIDEGAPFSEATRLPPAASVAAAAPLPDARVAGMVAANEARAVGIDLGFVAMPPTNGSGPLAASARAPGSTSAGLRAFVEGARAAGLQVGLVALWAGGVTDPTLFWDRARLEAVELAIAREVLKEEPEALALGPVRLPAITGDSTRLPLSAAALRGLVRRHLAYDGLVVADLASDGELVAAHGPEEAAVRAIAAGADLLIRVDDPVPVVDAIVAAVREGRLAGERVESAATRVVAAGLAAARSAAPLPFDSVRPVLGAPAAVELARRLEAMASGPAPPPPARELSAGSPAAAGMDPAGLARVDRLIADALDDSVFTAAALAVGRRGSLVRLRGYGPGIDATTTIFDIASLTKVVATTTAAAILVERGEMELDGPVRRYLPEWRGDDKGDVTIRHLLTHTSGLPPGIWLFGSARSPRQAIRQTLEQPLVRSPGERVEYSDLGMILLAEAIEHAAGMPIDEFLALHVFAPLGMQRTMFLPPLALAPAIVPTAETTERVFPLWGIVHDANAFRLGGVAGHAGLFSTARDLAVFAQMILNGGSYSNVRVLSPSTLAAFTARQPGTGNRALGWDTPDDRSSAGRFFSASSYGHTGYTGTSLWIDPELELFVVLLTNRTYTGASSADILRLRAAVHDAVASAVTDVNVRPRPGSRRQR